MTKSENALPVIEPEHAQFSPSSLGMFEKCPGFRNRNQDTAASLRGTRIHEALENDTVDALEDENERHLGQKCRDFIESICTERLPALPDKDFREIRLKIDLRRDVKTFGTCDRLLIYGAKGIMIDFKSGYRAITDAAENAQAFAYVIGAFQMFLNLQEIEFYFLIPNRDEISFHKFARADVPEMQLRLNTIIRRAENYTEDQLNPGPELCEYCARQTTCPALAKKSLSVAAQLTDGLPVPVSILVDKARPEDIPHLLRLAPLVEAWAKGVREEALRLSLEEGLEVAGFKRQERKLPRAVTSVMGAWDIVKDQISLEDFLAACGKVSLPQLEDLVRAKAKRGKKIEAEKKLTNDLRHADLMREEGIIYYLREDKK